MNEKLKLSLYFLWPKYGNPIYYPHKLHNAINVLYNASEFFYNINVPTNIFYQGYVDMEWECPSSSANIVLWTSKPLSTFFIKLIGVDHLPPQSIIIIMI